MSIYPFSPEPLHYLKTNYEGYPVCFMVTQQGLDVRFTVSKENLPPVSKVIKDTKPYVQELRKQYDDWDKALLILRKHPKDSKEIDLSNCGLTESLPPQIGCYTCLEKLNLKGNNLLSLPPELQYLPLKELNISGNKGLTICLPQWLGRIPKIRLIALDLRLASLPEGLEASRVECLNKQELLDYEDIRAQLPLSDDDFFNYSE